MDNCKKIVFLTGTRADFGKLKSLIEITSKSTDFEVYIFATGMHLSNLHGYTVEEIEKSGFTNIEKYENHTSSCSMDQILAKTISGLSDFVHKIKPDLIVIHGDRVETLAGAITGSLNNILVAHIEGGEISGTIDELIRHAVSKMSHVHFVANDTAKKRLIQMGELDQNIFVIGSPDVDAMISSNLPAIEQVKSRYGISFDTYGVLLFHPVTTEIENIHSYCNNLVDSIIESGQNYVVIFPNNDMGSSIILNEYERFRELPNFKVFPSMRFEYFLTMLKNAAFLIGNSSAGIREAPYYGLPVINIGTRQQNRALHNDIINCGYGKNEIGASIQTALHSSFESVELFGQGNSDKLFYQTISGEEFWDISKQKQFKDI